MVGWLFCQLKFQNVDFWPNNWPFYGPLRGLNIVLSFKPSLFDTPQNFNPKWRSNCFLDSWLKFEFSIFRWFLIWLLLQNLARDLQNAGSIILYLILSWPQLDRRMTFLSTFSSDPLFDALFKNEFIVSQLHSPAPDLAESKWGQS